MTKRGATSQRVVRAGFTESVTFELKLERSEGAINGNIQLFQKVEITIAKVLK